ncbi:ParB N-terminal domain-containing protein [Marivita sp. GX14005]|uniref:ParB/RepB/Spo0J family partition protein n=1 Tax=Marivita sp. GX14005 TaxID=2942276 RepID=UPI0020189412|nr:ParB N-terminal domain-containing protein [Marivita sp. GX14005]MCL3883221.1 ParB N-terminal domain-containing protein [Marivita sp. GX14005]
MSRKRRIFDIEMPEEPAPAEAPKAPDTAPQRRSPMASAIAENAGALSSRAEAEARIRAENDALAHEYVGLKRAGLVSRLIPLGDVVTEALVRDRAPGADPDMGELIASIREVGLSNPIRVEEREDGRYELIQGWRRLSAYKALYAETGSDEWAAIPAGILPHGEGLAGMYRRMVDENLVRRDLSFAEMATVARAYAADPDTAPTSVDDAVTELFRSAAYNKRSYIRAFSRLLDLLGPALKFSQDIPRNLGLAVLKRLEEDASLVAELRARLQDGAPRSAGEELAILRAFTAPDTPEAPNAPRPAAGAGQGGSQPTTPPRRPRTTFDLSHEGERVKCTAGVGQLTLKLDRDLSRVERRKLEAGIVKLLNAIS